MTLDLARKGLAELQGFGRALKESDRRRLAAKKFPGPAAAGDSARGPGQRGSALLPEGRVLEDGSKGAGAFAPSMERGTEDGAREGEGAYEGGAARVAPEFRKALEEYYKTIAK
jgi:hypothetical protein